MDHLKARIEAVWNGGDDAAAVEEALAKAASQLSVEPLWQPCATGG